MDELAGHLAAARRALRAAIDAVPADRHAVAPAAGRWSTAQIVEHLGLVERQVVGLLRRAFDRSVAAGLARETATGSVLATFAGDRLLDRQRRFTAPPSAATWEGLGVADGWRALEASRERLLALLAAADGYAVGSITAPHPLLGEFDFYQWVAFVGFHELRHAAQIREAVAAPLG